MSSHAKAMTSSNTAEVEGEPSGPSRSRKELRAVIDEDNYSKLLQLSDQLGHRTKRALDIIQSQSLSASVEELVSTASALSDAELKKSKAGDSQNLTVDSLIAQMQQASEAFNAVNKYLTEVCSGQTSNESDGGDVTF